MNNFKISTAALALAAVMLGAPDKATAQVFYSTNFDSMSQGSIFGQEGWTDQNQNGNGNNYVQGVTTAASLSGSQSWLLSSSYNDGTVCTISTPTFAAVGESNTVFGGTPAYNQFNETFSFRTVSTSADPGLYISNSLGTAASVRNTWVGIQEIGGNLVVGAYATDPSGNFTINPTTGPLTWGDWYTIKVSADFVNGPNNDQVNYEVLDSSGNVLMNATIGSWESYYANNPGAEQAPGPIASNRVTFGLGGSGTDQGIYIDNFSVGVSVAAVPEPSTWALLLGGLGLLTYWRLRKHGAI